MACGVVTGGLMYFSQMRLPSVRMAASKALPAAAMVIGVVGRVGGFEPLPVFAGELGVDGEEGLAGVAGEADGELDDLLGVGFDAGVADELAGREHLLEQHAELDFGEAAAGFDVGEDAGEVVDAFGELGHLAEADVHLVELIGDLAEGFGEAGLQGGVELFVDRGAHLFELGGVGGVELIETGFDGGAEFFLVAGVGRGEVGEAGVEGFAEAGVLGVGVGGEGAEAGGEGVEAVLDGAAEVGGGGGVVFAEAGQAGVKGAAQGSDAGGDLGAEDGVGGGVLLAGVGGLGGEVGAELGEGGAEVGVGGLEPGVDAGELVGEQCEAGVGRGCGRFAEEQEEDGEKEDELENEGDGHSVFLRLQGSTLAGVRTGVLQRETRGLCG